MSSICGAEVSSPAVDSRESNRNYSVMMKLFIGTFKDPKNRETSSDLGDLCRGENRMLAQGFKAQCSGSSLGCSDSAWMRDISILLTWLILYLEKCKYLKLKSW